MLKANLSISRPYGGRSDENPYINVTIRDANSRIDFVSLQVPLASFAEALTGLSEVEADMVVRGLNNVGKVREHQHLPLVLTKAYLKEKRVEPYGRELEKFLSTDPDGLISAHETDGWKVDVYLRSQTSVTPDGKGDTAIRVNLSRHRYVDPQPTEEAK